MELLWPIFNSKISSPAINFKKWIPVHINNWKTENIFWMYSLKRSLIFLGCEFLVVERHAVCHTVSWQCQFQSLGLLGVWHVPGPVFDRIPVLTGIQRKSSVPSKPLILILPKHTSSSWYESTEKWDWIILWPLKLTWI